MTKKGIIGGDFESYGNEPQCFVDGIGGYEYLPGGNVRLFLTTTRNGISKVDHETIVPLSLLAAIGQKLIEIAASKPVEMLPIMANVFVN